MSLFSQIISSHAYCNSTTDILLSICRLSVTYSPTPNKSLKSTSKSSLFHNETEQFPLVSFSLYAFTSPKLIPWSKLYRTELLFFFKRVKKSSCFDLLGEFVVFYTLFKKGTQKSARLLSSSKKTASLSSSLCSLNAGCVFTRAHS